MHTAGSAAVLVPACLVAIGGVAACCWRLGDKLRSRNYGLPIVSIVVPFSWFNQLDIKDPRR